MVIDTQESLHIFFEGDDYFESLWRDLSAAQHTILVEMYILEEDEIGDRFKDILIEKAAAGVKIKVLADAIGSLQLSRACIGDMRRHGVYFRLFHPLRLLLPAQLQLNRRDHRKMVVIDNKIGYLGGMNLFRKQSRQFYGEQRWRDTQVRLTGPLVDKMTYHFRRSFRELLFRSRRLERYTQKNDIVATRNIFGRNHIKRFIQRHMRRSRADIGITTAYFVPDLTTIFLLVRAVHRGVRVRVITNSPQYNDVPLVNRINRPILKYLIKKGVSIHFFNDRMLHAKSVFFDDRIATVGSANINYRSFYRDLEINIFIQQNKSIQALKTQFEHDLSNSRQVSHEELDNISLWQKILDGLCYLIRSFF